MAGQWALAWGLLGAILAMRLQLLFGLPWPESAWVIAEMAGRWIAVGLLSALGFLAILLVLGPRVHQRGWRIVAGLVPAGIAFAAGATMEPGYVTATIFALFALICAMLPFILGT